MIIFIPEQLEDTSLNVLPKELSKSHPSELRDGDREGLGLWQCSNAPRFQAAHAHTHTTQRIPENPRAARYPPSAVRQKPEWELLLRKVSVNVHISLVDVANYGTGGCPVWTEQYGYSLFPVGKTNTWALWEETERLVSTVQRHQHGAEDTSQGHSVEGMENPFLFSPTSPATQFPTSDSPLSPSSLGHRAEDVDAEPTTPPKPTHTTQLQAGTPSSCGNYSPIKSRTGRPPPQQAHVGREAGLPVGSAHTHKAKPLPPCPVQTQTGTLWCCRSSQCWQ